MVPLPNQRLGRIAAALALALTACSAPPSREGAPVTPQSAGPTIVSLNPCTDAILVEVADPGQILALSHYSHDPASSSLDQAVARRWPATGGTVEEVLALRPALVIDSTFTPPATRSALEHLGLRLEQVGMASTPADSMAQVRRIAALAGHPERGEALARRIEAALAANTAPPGPPVPAILWQGGGIVAGEGTLISALMAHAGFANAATARGLAQASYLPLEDMIARPPRVILTGGNGVGEDDRLLAHPALKALPQAIRAPLDPALIWCGGPTIPKALARLGAVRRMVGQR